MSIMIEVYRLIYTDKLTRWCQTQLSTKIASSKHYKSKHSSPKAHSPCLISTLLPRENRPHGSLGVNPEPGSLLACSSYLGLEYQPSLTYLET